MKELNEAIKALDMVIDRDWKGGKVSLTQKEYLKKVLQKFNINGDMKSVSTPLASHFKLKAIVSPTSIEERKYMTHVPYVSTILMYAMLCIRLDLS